MKAHIIYNDSFIIGVDQIIDSIENLYKCKRVDFNDIYRKESINGTVVAKEMQSYLENRDIIPDKIYHELMIKELRASNSDVLIQNYPRTKDQWNLLKDFLDNSGFTVGKIWYLEAMNVIKNIQKVEKYKIQAERHDPTLSHIKKQLIKSKLSNINRIEFLNKLENLEIVGVESFGVGGIDYLKNIFPDQKIQTKNDQT